jgi:hypothetical protein
VYSFIVDQIPQPRTIDIDIKRGMVFDMGRRRQEAQLWSGHVIRSSSMLLRSYRSVNWIGFYENFSDSQIEPNKGITRCLVHTVHSQRLAKFASPHQRYRVVNDTHRFLEFVIRGTMSRDSYVDRLLV